MRSQSVLCCDAMEHEFCLHSSMVACVRTLTHTEYHHTNTRSSAQRVRSCCSVRCDIQRANTTYNLSCAQTVYILFMGSSLYLPVCAFSFSPLVFIFFSSLFSFTHFIPNNESSFHPRIKPTTKSWSQTTLQAHKHERLNDTNARTAKKQSTDRRQPHHT